MCRQQPSLALGPRGDPRHRGHPDARRPGRSRAARPHRPAGGLLGQQHRPPGGHQRRRRRGHARLGRRGDPRRRTEQRLGGLHDRRLHRHPARASCARARSARPSSTPPSRASAPSWRPSPSQSPSPSQTPRPSPSRSRTDPEPTVREYLLVFLVAGVASYLLCVFARELAIRSGAVARVRDRDVHATPIPYFGGVAMLGGLGAGLLVAHHLPFLSTSQPTVFHDSGIVLIAGAMICAVGVVDDLIELDALTKLGGQIVAAGFLVLNGVQLWSLNAPRRRASSSLDPTPGRAALDAAGRRHHERRQLRRRARRPRRGRGADRVGRVLPVLLPARRRQRLHARDHRGACSAPRWVAPAPASCRTTSSRPASSWATPARCCSAWCSPGRRSPSPASSPTSPSTRAGAPRGSIVMLLPILLPISILVVPLADLVLAVVRRTRRGPGVLPAGQGAPAPPAARDRAQPASRRADHVAVGRADRVRRRTDQPLLRPADLGRCSRSDWSRRCC